MTHLLCACPPRPLALEFPLALAPLKSLVLVASCHDSLWSSAPLARLHGPSSRPVFAAFFSLEPSAAY